MLNLFYTELYIGQKDICDQLVSKLNAHNVACKVSSIAKKRVNLFTPFNSSYATLGIREDQQRRDNSDHTNICYLYVKKSDLELSKRIINE